MSIEQIVMNAGMSARPEFYSGRGAILSDLNSTILEKVYQGIKAEYGQDAASSFAQMVANTDKLSATLFLTSLFRLYLNDWQVPEPKQSSTLDHTDVGPDDGGRMAVGFATIANALSGQTERNETPMIVGDFLHKHRDEITPRIEERFLDNRGTFYYGDTY